MLSFFVIPAQAGIQAFQVVTGAPFPDDFIRGQVSRGWRIRLHREAFL